MGSTSVGGARKTAFLAVSILTAVGLSALAAGATGTSLQRVPRLKHVDLIVFENHERDTLVVTHYSLLRTIEAVLGLPPLGNAEDVSPIRGIWRP